MDKPKPERDKSKYMPPPKTKKIMSKQIERPEFLQVTEDFWYLRKGQVIKLNEKKQAYCNHSQDRGIAFDIIDRLPDLFVEYKNKRQIEIKMVVTVESTITDDDINYAFVGWVEKNGWTCGGSVKELDE